MDLKPLFDRAGTGAPSTRDLSRNFTVVVHDVTPALLPQLVAIVDALRPRLAGKLNGAVVPCWHGSPLDGIDAAALANFRMLVSSAFGEILQHGFTHRQDAPGLISWLSGSSNELDGLSIAETRRRLAEGRALLDRALGVEVAGFVPPAWRVGHANVRELARLGFGHLVAFDAIRPAEGPPIPLVTYSWDWGIAAPLGRVGEGFARGWARIRPDAVSCVVIHPLDVDRGYLPRILRMVDRLRDAGGMPVTFAELVTPSIAGVAA